MAWEIALVFSVFFSMFAFFFISFLIKVNDSEWSRRDIGLYLVKNVFSFVGLLHIPFLFVVCSEILVSLDVGNESLSNLMVFGVVFSGALLFAYLIFNVMSVYEQLCKVLLDKDDEY